MSKVRTVFLGTPEFATSFLKALIEDSHFEVVGVITQPDRPAGRKLQLQASAVKSFCMEQQIPVLSPESVNTEDILQTILNWGAEVAVVVAFGQLLSERFLKMFPLGAVNVHGSLLPRWRGAAPIQRAIEFGDSETGVVLQKVVKKLDAGDVLGIRKISINVDTTSSDLYLEMSKVGTELLHVELMDYVRGNLTGTQQSESEVTYAKKIEKSEGLIDWSLPADKISQKIRAFNMGPGTWTFHENKKIKIHKIRILTPSEAKGIENPLEPGKILKAESSDLWVQTSKGVLALLEIQPESRNRLSSEAFLKGKSIKKGDIFSNKGIESEK